MFSHVMVGVNDLERSRKFYDALFATMGIGPGVSILAIVVSLWRQPVAEESAGRRGNHRFRPESASLGHRFCDSTYTSPVDTNRDKRYSRMEKCGP